MANQQGNGRNTSMSDEDRSSWRPDDDSMSMRDRDRDRDRDDERMFRDRFRDDERFMQRERERVGPSWDDRSSRGWDREDSRSGGWRSIDRGGQGQSGYGAGREGDRSYQSRNSGYPASFDDRMRERGVDERFAIGRGSSSGYEGGSHYLGQGNQQMGGWGNQMGHGSQQGNYDRSYMGQRSGMHSGAYGQPGDWNQSGGNWSGMNDQRFGPQGMHGGYGPQGGYGPHGMHQQAIQNDFDQDHRTTYGQTYGYAGTGVGGGYQQGNPGGYGFALQQGYGQSGRHEEHESLGHRIKGWFQGHRGKGPVGYTRSDERIRETVCEALSDDDRVDASSIDVQVKNGEVTLTGTVEDRMQKRMAEECIENLSGVKDVQNQLRISMDASRRGSTMTSSSTSTVHGTESEKSSSPNGTDKRNRA